MKMKKYSPGIFCFVLLLALSAWALNSEPLTHRGVIPLTVEPLASDFAARIPAQGTPVFYVSNVSKGVSQGDIIRFRDKAVLIDGDVWQTMQNMGVLTHLSNLPLLTLNARARSSVWDSRSRQVSGTSEIKGYTLGREMLKIFEDYFGNTPSGMELVVSFSGANMTLVAPRQLINELAFSNVLRLQGTREAPLFVTTEPPQRVFTQQEFYWKIWAVDPVEPSAQLRYSFSAVLPPGLSWDPAQHAISGIPQDTGSWPLTFAVRNNRGQTVTLECTLTVIENTPPRIGVHIDRPVVAGEMWQYTPFISDAEHTLDELEVRLFEHPEGIRIDQQTKTVAWDVPQEFQDSVISFFVAARDPLNAMGREKIELSIISREQAQKPLFIDLRIPLDTLIQGHIYRWPERTLARTDWHRQQVEVQSVEGDNRTFFTKGSAPGDGVLTIEPMEHGLHTLVFTFEYDTDTVRIEKECVVIPNRPPVFKSRLTSNTFRRGQLASYTPVVFDKDNDSLHLAVIGADGEKRGLEGGTLTLPTENPGMHTLLLTATDPFGNSAQQHLYYHVKPGREHHRVLFLQQPYRKSFDIGYQSGSFRLGFYFADIFKTLTTGFVGLNTYESPFLYIGGNPLGEKQAALDNYLFVDCGISFRMYNQQLYGGGIMGRIQADYRHEGTSPWRFKGLFSLRVKQSIFVVDTSGLQQKLRHYTDEWSNDGQSDHLSQIENLSELFEAYGREDNLGLFLILETLYELPHSFWLGPALWIQDDIEPLPNQPLDSDNGAGPDRGNFLVQHTGISLLHDWNRSRVTLSQQLRLGWGGRRFSPQIRWNAAVTIKAR